MCGRVVSASPRDYLAAHFGAGEVVAAELPLSYNAAPGATLYAVAGTRNGRRLGTMRWGLVPSWSANPGDGPRPINARAETLLERPIFGEALARRRAVVPVSGFYEWKDGPDGKQPFLLAGHDGLPLALAVLWDRWAGLDGDPLVTFAIVTTAGNEDVAPLHDRMPALLSPNQCDRWLDPSERSADRLMPLLAPAPAGTLAVREVSRRVNDARNDDRDLVFG